MRVLQAWPYRSCALTQVARLHAGATSGNVPGPSNAGDEMICRRVISSCLALTFIPSSQAMELKI
jgi:hypothetical protein